MWSGPICDLRYARSWNDQCAASVGYVGPQQVTIKIINPNAATATLRTNRWSWQGCSPPVIDTEDGGFTVPTLGK